MNSSSTNFLQSYFDLMTANGSTFVFHTAKAMNLFGLMARQEAFSLADFVNGSKCDAKAAELLLNCFVGMGLLGKQDQSYRPTPTFQMVSGAYSQLGKEYWDHLPKYLMSGQPLVQMDSIESSEAEYVRQVQGLDWMMRPAAKVAMDLLLKPLLESNIRILDLGAGSGVWSYQVLETFKSATATLVDWPGVLKIAESKAIERGMRDRVTLLSGNYHELDFQGPYNKVFFGNITHLESPTDLFNLLKKAKEVLVPNGEVVIFDVFDTQPRGQLAFALYSLGLGLRTQKGKVYSVSELKNFCADCGFAEFSFINLEVSPYTMGMLRASLVDQK